MFPGMEADLSKRVSFDNYKYAIWEEYVIIFVRLVTNMLQDYRVVNRYQDITRIFD